MAKLDLTTIQGQYASTTELNNNFALIETALENTVSRDGTTPNTMSADLDLNSQDINNADTINANALIIAGTSIVGGDTLTVPGASNVPNTPAGNIVATDVQDAIDELDTEKVGIAGTETVTGDKTFSGTTVLSGATTTISGDAAIGGDASVTGSLTVTEDVTISRTLVQKIGTDVLSDATLALGFGNMFDITGTTNISSIDTEGVGTKAVLQFDGVLTLIHHATDLVLPGAANIVTAAGDIAVFYEYATGDWRCISYTKSSQAPLEETIGTWTPTIVDSSLSSSEGQGYTSQNGSYVRIGNMVTFSFYIDISSLGTLTTSDRASIGGLPFAPYGGVHIGGCNFSEATSLAITAGTSITGQIDTSAFIKLSVWESIGGANGLLVSEVSAGAKLNGYGQYLATA